MPAHGLGSHKITLGRAESHVIRKGLGHVCRFEQDVCRNLDAACRREWLETNGIGAFASSTIVGLNTRRYHGLLVAAIHPPVGRMVLLSKVEETLVIDGQRVELSSNRYPGAIHPQGYLYMKEFRRDPLPTFVYEIKGCVLEKSVCMVHGENSTVIRYKIRGLTVDSCKLELRPLIAFRDYHSLTHENEALNPSLEIDAGSVRMAPYADLPSLYVAHSSGEVHASGYWYRNFEYTMEQQRGLDYREDLFQPFVLVFELKGDSQAALIASTERHNIETAEAARTAEIERRQRILASAPSSNPFVRELALAADQFIVQRGTCHSVIAGYHWFSDWGRDAMISLPGLTLATGRPEIAQSVLLAFSRYVDHGMLPNRFPDAGETPEYNTVDATLWFFEALRAYAAYTNDYEFVRARLYGVLAEIISWHERGTRYGIRVDSDGLLLADEPGVQLTWMDAKAGDWVVTPRRGKPVEIQALWYNALRIMEDLAERFGRNADREHFRALADRAQQSFPRLFWNETAGCLFDVVDRETRDDSIRPNQIFAVSLPHKLLPPEKGRRVVAAVEHHLLTPYGLRSLAPSDPKYHGRYEGDVRSRDGAYHQGTVWPWLLGAFITAYLEVNERSPNARKQAAQWLEELCRFMNDEGVGQIPEIFDGDAPQRSGGCIAQAWSVAEILRTAMELEVT